MNIHEIKKLVQILGESDITEFSYEKEGVSVKISRGVQTQVQMVPQGVYQPQQGAAPVYQSPVGTAEEKKAAPEEENVTKVACPVVGTFYRRSSPDASPFVDVGSRVKKGDTLCIVEAMKVMNEVEAPCDGTIAKVLVSEATVVEYGEVLFHITPL